MLVRIVRSASIALMLLFCGGALAQSAGPTQLVQILQDNPDNRLARWQLAQMLFQTGRYDSARYHVSRLLNSATSGSDIRVLTRALSDINRADPISYQLTFAFLPSTNIRRYTYNSVFETELGIFRPVGGGEEESGIGLSFGGQVNYSIPLENSAQLTFGLSLNQRIYEASDLNGTQLKATVRYQLFQVGRTDSFEPYINFSFDENLDLEQRRVGVTWDRTWLLDQDNRVTLSFTGEQREEIGSEANAGPFARIRLRYRTALTADLNFTTSVGISRYNVSAGHLAYTGYDVSANLTQSFERIGVLGVFATVSRQGYDDTFPATSITREDDEFRWGISYIPPRSIRIGDWQPRLSCAVVDNSSNIDLYDYRAVDCGFNFVQSF